MLVKSSLTTLALAAHALAAPAAQPYASGTSYDYEKSVLRSVVAFVTGPPAGTGSTLATKYDRNFTTVPQANVNGRIFSVNRGKVLGSSSALNLMSYDRSAAGEYHSWEALGNPGWNWETMIAAMKKSESLKGGRQPPQLTFQF